MSTPPVVQDPGTQSAGTLDLSTYTPFDSGRPAEAPVSPAASLRQSITYGVEQDPDAYAKLLQQQRVTGMAPEVAKPLAGETQQAIDVESLNPEQMAVSHPRTAAWAAHPDNAAVAGADELHRLTRIEQHAAVMRATDPTWTDRIGDAAQRAFEFLGGQGRLSQQLFDFPLGRLAVGTVRGAEEMAGNVGSFAGIHGDNGGPNRLQRMAQRLSPESFGETPTGLDALAENVGPMVPALMASGGTSLLARTLGLSDKAAKVLAATGIGAMFSASQGGATLTSMMSAGRPAYDARLAANREAAITLPFNAAAGMTDLVPGLRRFPLLASLGVGGATGASGQLAQNVATDQPWQTGLLKSTVQGAAVQAGLHTGFSFLDAMGETVAEVEQSKLRTRSPEKFQEALETQFAGDPSVRIPAQDFVNYFTAQKLDPAEMANRVGVTNLDEAAAAGSDLEIPKANFFGQLDPEHQKGLLPDVVDPATDLTARQTEEGRQELEEAISSGKLQQLVDEYQAADKETQATPEWQKVQSELKQRYLDAGETETVAENQATLQANAYAYFAKNAGLKPDELLALQNPVVTAAEGAPGEVLHQSAPEGEEESGFVQRRKERNLEAARTQGELLKAAKEGLETTPGTAEGGRGESPEPEAGGETRPASETGTRGWFRILGPGRYEIGKTKIGDVSTFIHEPAHAYLEFFRELTQRGEASESLKADFRKITEWLGTTPEEAHRNGFTREQHEQWARANEQYVREGKAPSSGLQRVFQHFSVWLSTIYRRASALGVELSPEVRGVMDRLYAGEEAVDRAEQETARPQIFATPEEAGMTEAEHRNYAEAKGIEVEKAREQVRAELNEAAERERTQLHGDVREAVTAQVDARPEYRAIRALRKGALEDGTTLTLNREALAAQFGEERVKALNELHRGLYRREGGTDAETAAELLGFNSGEEMVRALEQAPRRSQAITAATREYLVNKYGDVRYDGTLTDRARFAIENNERAGNIYRELKALRTRVASLEKKASDVKAAMAAITTEPLEHYQEAARQIIDAKPIADLQPHRYLEASRKYSREAFDALRKGNARAAADAKNKELLNHFLFREASAAREWVDKFERNIERAQSIGAQQHMGLADENAKNNERVGDYRDQHNWLLNRYHLAQRGAMMTTPPERSLRRWADDLQGQGWDTAIAESLLNDARFADYRSVPMSELRDLHDALVNIRHLAQQEFKMFVGDRKIAFGEAKAALIQRARESFREKPEMTFAHNRTLLDRAADPARYADARLLMMERAIEWLDGGKTGPWHDYIWNLLSDAQGDEDGLQHEVTQTVMEALEKMPPEMRRKIWSEKASVDGVGEPLTRRDMLSMAFNFGNEGNLDRLQKTFVFKGWDPDAIKRIGGILTREEWQFIQGVWDALKPLGERANDLQRKATGLPLKMVEVKPFKVALGDGAEMEMGGGYYPIVYDPKFVVKGYDEEAAKAAQNAMQAGYVRATTSKGYTNERTGSAGPLLLDYEHALTSHVAKVTKDLSHRMPMLTTQRLLLDPDVRRALRETIGPQYEEQMMPWLRGIINDNNGSVQERLDTVKDFMQKSRANFVTASLSFNPGTLLLQVAHAPRMLRYAKPASLVQSFVDLLARPVEATREIRDLSPNEMRFRGDHLDRDLRSVLQKTTFGGYERKIATAGRFALQMMDHLLSHTLWRAAFNDAAERYSDLAPEEAQKKAVYEADAAVRLGLGAHAPKDLPAIMRNNEFNKFITTLYGFHNGIYNQIRDDLHQLRYSGNIGKFTYATFLSAVLPAVVGSWLTGQRPNENEKPGWWAAKRSLLFAADTMPVVRAVASAIEGGHDVQFSPIENVLTKGAHAAMQAASDKDDKDWLGIGINEGEAIGDLLGVPGAHQAAKTLRYVHRVGQGKIAHPSLYGALVSGH